MLHHEKEFVQINSKYFSEFFMQPLILLIHCWRSTSTSNWAAVLYSTERVELNPFDFGKYNTDMIMIFVSTLNARYSTRILEAECTSLLLQRNFTTTAFVVEREGIHVQYNTRTMTMATVQVHAGVWLCLWNVKSDAREISENWGFCWGFSSERPQSKIMAPRSNNLEIQRTKRMFRAIRRLEKIKS